MTPEELANIETLTRTVRSISDAELELAVALKDGYKADKLAPYFTTLRLTSHELATAIIILVGGYPFNVGNDNEKALFFSKIRSQHVSDAKVYLDRVKGALDTMFNVSTAIPIPAARNRLAEAYGYITHDFNFRLPFDSAFPPTIIRPHGDYPYVLNRLFFTLKYWRDWLGNAITVLPNSPQPAWANAVIQYTNGTSCIHRCISMIAGNVYLPIEADPFEKAGRLLKLTGFDIQRRLKQCTESWSDVGLRSAPFKEASKKLGDAWFHSALVWIELMKMIGSKKFQWNWEVLEF